MFVLLHYTTKWPCWENRQRMAHLDAATRHLKDKTKPYGCRPTNCGSPALSVKWRPC